MRRDIIKAGRSLAFLFIIFIFGSYIIVAQSEITGEWTAKASDKSPDKIYLSMSRRTSDNGKNQNGSTFEYSELQGLSREQTAGGSVRFSLVREAGTIECEGRFENGKGSGTFRFVPNMSYVSAMQSRGFDFTKSRSDRSSDTTEERLLAAALINVTVAQADDLRSANFDNLDVGDLFKAAIFKIDGKFMAEMKATGFPNLQMEDLVKARIFKIDADYVREIKDMGFGADSFENLVKYRIFKVTPQYLSELRAEGLTDLDPEQIVQLKIFNVDASYVREQRAKDPGISVEKLVQKKIGVWGK
ncbi:MAG: hypothetical protein QUS14_00115 [Pyrinomonadaceae bacterium]|nr:hypothetical protein [Pyrinomonadaceae bacterium]